MRDNSVLDARGYRPNVGMVLVDTDGRVLWARRAGQDAWQFPQGGIQAGESPEEALFRELHEEVGLRDTDVHVVHCTRGWLRYRLPGRYRRRDTGQPRCVGQKQKWFLLEMRAADTAIDLTAGGAPEFDDWRWVSYWYPLGQVIAFKREVYRRALQELAPPLHRRLRRQDRERSRP